MRKVKEKCCESFIYHRWKINAQANDERGNLIDYKCKRDPKCLASRYSLNAKRKKEYINGEWQEYDKLKMIRKV